MPHSVLQAKLYRVAVTHTGLHYEGSCGIDAALLAAAGIHANQRVEIYNICNGERFSTNAIVAPEGSGRIALNGAAARKAVIGDLLIICAYAHCTQDEVARHQPVVVLVDQRNRMIERIVLLGKRAGLE